LIGELNNLLNKKPEQYFEFAIGFLLLSQESSFPPAFRDFAQTAYCSFRKSETTVDASQGKALLLNK